MALFGFKPRFGNVRLLVGVSDREDGRSGGLLLGATTYAQTDDGDETYATSYLEWGGRSDHLVNAMCAATGVDAPVQLVSEAGDDVAYTATVAQNAKRRKVAEGATPAVQLEPAA